MQAPLFVGAEYIHDKWNCETSREILHNSFPYITNMLYDVNFFIYGLN
jgi:hypothetical protein